MVTLAIALLIGTQLGIGFVLALATESAVVSQRFDDVDAILDGINGRCR